MQTRDSHFALKQEAQILNRCLSIDMHNILYWLVPMFDLLNPISFTIFPPIKARNHNGVYLLGVVPIALCSFQLNARDAAITDMFP